MSLLKKLAGLAVGAAAVGAAVYVLQKREHGEEYEHIVGPADEVETDTAEPEADASAEAEKAPAAAPETDDAVYQPPVAAHPVENGDDTPNANPVELGAVEVPKTADGKYDATKIADPADFGDWDEQGCKG